MKVCKQCRQELKEKEFKRDSDICKECENENKMDKDEREDWDSYTEHFSDN